MTARSYFASGIAVGAMLVGLTGEALARERSHISPYLEVDQTVATDLKGGSNDILTYTDIAVGVDGSIRSSRTEATFNLRYEHQFDWNANGSDTDVVSGIASARYEIMHDRLSIEGGVLATRSRSEGAGGSNGSIVNIGDTGSDIYSAYVGPTFTSAFGALSVNAAYRLGYTRVEDQGGAAFAGQPLNGFDDSVFHSLTASVGMQPGALPFGWSVGAGYDREDASELDNRYEDWWTRADVTVPITQTLAAVGGVGWESTKISNRDAVRDGLGNPIVDGSGRYVTNTASPRQLAYDNDGIMWDAGVLWRPSRRTSLELRVGQRYDSWHYVGTFRWQPDSRSSLSIAYFDTIDSFGRSVNRGLDNVSSDFSVRRNPFSGDLTGCVDNTQGGGSCFNDALTGITSANFRHKGVIGQYSYTSGLWYMGVGGGWSQRKFIAPAGGILASASGAADDNYFANLFVGRPVGASSSIDLSLYGNMYDAAAAGFDVTNYGGYVTYNHGFSRRLRATASFGVDSVNPENLDSVVSALGQVSMRYQF